MILDERHRFYVLHASAAGLVVAAGLGQPLVGIGLGLVQAGFFWQARRAPGAAARRPGLERGERPQLAAGRSHTRVLIKAYRRNTGGGTFATMKDISAPIAANGRHWGGLRIGYRRSSSAPRRRAP